MTNLAVLENRQYENTTNEWTFMLIHALDRGVTVNERFFIGRLPIVGEAVELVFIGNEENGAMRFQLRVKPE